MENTDYLHMPNDHMDNLYSKGNILDRFVHCGRLRQILHGCPKSAEKLKVLDAGCGEGHLIHKFHELYPHFMKWVFNTEISLEVR